MANVIVTGGVGFIGYHLTHALLARGDRVTVIDDFCDTPYPTFEKRRNEADLEEAWPDTFQCVKACISERARIAPYFQGIDGVFHLAGLAGVRPSFRDPARYARVNVEGAATIFELARNANVERFILASSSSVYGNSTPLPAHEDAPAMSPESPYAASKRAGELAIAALARGAPEMACAALRFFTVYGPRQRPEMAISLFTRACLGGEALTLFGDGSMRRDFTHVSDIVAGALAAFETIKPGYRVYNLGSGTPVDLLTLVAAIGTATAVSPRIERSPVPLGDVDATFADVSRAARELGWTPRVDLASGLKTVVEWVRTGR